MTPKMTQPVDKYQGSRIVVKDPTAKFVPGAANEPKKPAFSRIPKKTSKPVPKMKYTTAGMDD